MKYKHKITGEEAFKSETFADYYHVDTNMIPKRFIEDSNDWEKLEEKDYEILSLIGLDGSIVHKIGYTFPECFQTLVDAKDSFKIHSVKRLTDGEVFTVGDNINFNDKGVAKLLEIQFEIAPADKGKGTLCFVNDHEFLGKWWTVDKLSKIKKSLFTTVDNVEIYGGESIYAVSDDFQLLHCSFAQEKDKSIRSFSTKENAEKYILRHKPLLSLDDLLSVWSNYRDDELFSTSPLFHSFEELATKKLKK